MRAITMDTAAMASDSTTGESRRTREAIRTPSDTTAKSIGTTVSPTGELTGAREPAERRRSRIEAASPTKKRPIGHVASRGVPAT